MLEYGEISRQLLLGLWYYLPTEREEFIDLYELIGDFDLAYLVPQSDIPTSHTYCEPLLVSHLHFMKPHAGTYSITSLKN